LPEEIEFVRQNDGYFVFKIGSGTYRFEVRH
jgi:hypothetical protein